MIIQLYSFSFIHYHGIGLIGLIGWIGVDSLNRWIGGFALLWINECHFKMNWITKSAIKSPCFGTWKGQWKATGSGRRGGGEQKEREKKNEIKERKKKVEALIKKLKCRSRCQSLKWTAQVGIWKLQTLRPTFSTAVQATSTTLNFALIRRPFSHPPTHPHTQPHTHNHTHTNMRMILIDFILEYSYCNGIEEQPEKWFQLIPLNRFLSSLKWNPLQMIEIELEFWLNGNRFQFETQPIHNEWKWHWKSSPIRNVIETQWKLDSKTNPNPLQISFDQIHLKPSQRAKTKSVKIQQNWKWIQLKWNTGTEMQRMDWSGSKWIEMTMQETANAPFGGSSGATSA